jgi:hypothetical protein
MVFHKSSVFIVFYLLSSIEANKGAFGFDTFLKWNEPLVIDGVVKFVVISAYPGC